MGVRNTSVETKFTHFKMFTCFYNAPIIKFATHFAFYLVFLILHSVVLLTRFNPSMDPLEMITLWWIFTYFCDEIRQVCVIEWKNYIKETWNKIDVLIMVLTVLGYVLRFVPSGHCGQCFEAARIILSINLMAFTLRILHMYSIQKKLGPILVMIENMMKEMVHFMLIMMVFISSYGLALQAILYPNSRLDHHLLKNIFYKAYFQIYGELFLEELNGDVGDCSNDPNVYNNQTCAVIRCPENSWLGPVLLGFYILITNVMMLNLLIAMFSSVYDKIKDKSDLHWNYPRLALLKEFEHKPVLPPPFVTISHIYLLLKKCLPKNTNSDQRTDPIETIDDCNELKAYMKLQIANKNLQPNNKEGEDRVEALLRQQGEDIRMQGEDIRMQVEEIRFLKNFITRQDKNDKTLMSDSSILTHKNRQNKTDYSKRLEIETVSKVEGKCLIELQELSESGIPHHISRRPGSITPSGNQTFLVCGGYSPQVTRVKLEKQGNTVKSRVCNTYTLPEGISILSGVMIREQIVSGKQRELYMFVVEYEDDRYCVCTVSLDSNNITLRARYITEFSPIHPFHEIFSNKLGVLCEGYDRSDINRICVYSYDQLENPPDMYLDTLDHNTVQSTCDKIIDLKGSDGSTYNTICVTAHGDFCLGMFNKHNIQIHDGKGEFLTTIGTKVLHYPRTVMCTSDNDILVVAYLGDVHLYNKGSSSDNSDYTGGTWKCVKKKLNGRLSDNMFTYSSIVRDKNMCCVEWKDDYCKLCVYPIHTSNTNQVTHL